MNTQTLKSDQLDPETVQFRNLWHEGVAAAAHRLFRETFGQSIDENFSDSTRARIAEQGSLRQLAADKFSSKSPHDFDDFKCPTVDDGTCFDGSLGPQEFTYGGETFEFTQTIIPESAGEYALRFHVVWLSKMGEFEEVHPYMYLKEEEVRALFQAHEREFLTGERETNFPLLMRAMLACFLSKKS